MVTVGVWALLISEMLGSCATFVVLPMMPFYAMQMGASVMVVTLLGPSFYVAQMVCCAGIGTISSKIGRRQVLLWASLLQAAANTQLSFAATVPTLLFANLARGASLSSAPIITAYMMEDAKSEEDLSTTLTLQRLACSVGALGGPMVGRLMVKDHSFPFMCRGLVAVNILIVVIQAVSLRDADYTEEGGSPSKVTATRTTERDSENLTLENVARDIGRQCSDPVRCGLLSCFFTTTFLSGILEGPLLVFLKDHFGYDQSKAMEFFMAGMFAAIIGAVLVQLLLDGVGPFHGMSAYRLTILGSLGCAVFMFPLCIWTAPWVPMLAAMLVTGISTNMFQLGFFQLVNQRIPKSKVGSFLGLTSALGSAGATFAPPLGGVLYNVNNYLPVYFKAIGGLMATALFIFWLDEKHDENLLYLPDPADSSPDVLAALATVTRPVMADSTFVTRLAMQERILRFDVEISEAYQTYQDAALDESGFISKPFSVAGDRLVGPAVKAKNQKNEKQRGEFLRSRTEKVF